MPLKEHLPFTLLFIVCMISTGTTIFVIIENLKITDYNVNFQKRNQELELYCNNKHLEVLNNKTDSSWIVGISYGQYFCVWTEGRDYADIMKTCNHEYLHNEYWENWQHFDKDG